MIPVIEPHRYNFPGPRYRCAQTNFAPGKELCRRTLVHQSARGNSRRVAPFQERCHASEGPGRNSGAMSRSAQIDDPLLGAYPETPLAVFSCETDDSHQTLSCVRLNLSCVNPCPLVDAAKKRHRRNTVGSFTVSSAPPGRPRHIVAAPYG